MAGERDDIQDESGSEEEQGATRDATVVKAAVSRGYTTKAEFDAARARRPDEAEEQATDATVQQRRKLRRKVVETFDADGDGQLSEAEREAFWERRHQRDQAAVHPDGVLKVTQPEPSTTTTKGTPAASDASRAEDLLTAGLTADIDEGMAHDAPSAGAQHDQAAEAIDARQDMFGDDVSLGETIEDVELGELTGRAEEAIGTGAGTIFDELGGDGDPLQPDFSGDGLDAMRQTPEDFVTGARGDPLAMGDPSLAAASAKATTADGATYDTDTGTWTSKSPEGQKIETDTETGVTTITNKDGSPGGTVSSDGSYTADTNVYSESAHDEHTTDDEQSIVEKNYEYGLDSGNWQQSTFVDNAEGYGHVIDSYDASTGELTTEYEWKDKTPDPEGEARAPTEAERQRAAEAGLTARDGIIDPGGDEFGTATAGRSTGPGEMPDVDPQAPYTDPHPDGSDDESAFGGPSKGEALDDAREALEDLKPTLDDPATGELGEAPAVEEAPEAGLTGDASADPGAMDDADTAAMESDDSLAKKWGGPADDAGLDVESSVLDDGFDSFDDVGVAGEDPIEESP